MPPRPFIFNTVQSTYDLSGLNHDFAGSVTIQAEQDVPQDLIDRIKATRDYQDARTFSEITKGDDLEQIQIAEIPMAVIWKWRREGFELADICEAHRADPQTAARIILAKLRSEDLTAFQTTSKNF